MRSVFQEGDKCRTGTGMIAPLMVDVYRWMGPVTVSVTKGLKGMDEYVQVCLCVSFFF